jgi:ADP-ribosylglycohydrolase
VPAAAIAFLESSGYEDAVRNAVSLGGDADTLACIAGAMAEAHYGGTPEPIQRESLRRLDEPLRAEVLLFVRQYAVPLSIS